MPGSAVRWSRGLWSIVMLAAVVPAYGRPQTRTQGAARSAVTVMGEVRDAGVYVLPTANASLRNVLMRAGSLTPNASGSVKIVRGGRMTMQTHVRTGAAMQLRDGDVIVVAGPKSSSRETSAKPVEVALLDLIDRPLLPPLRPAPPAVQSLLRLLGQPADVAPTLRILGPVSRISNSDGNFALRSGAILVFDSRAIQRDRVPRLPMPIVVSRSQVRPVQGEEDEILNGPVFKPRASKPPTFPKITSKTPVPAAPPAMLNTDPQTPRATITVERDPPEMTGPSKQAASGNDDWRPAETPAPLAQAGIGVATGSATSHPGDATSEPSVGVATEPAGDLAAVTESGDDESAFNLLTMIIGLFAGLGVLAAGGFLWSMGRKAAAGDRPANRAIRQTASPLQRLLHNDLEVCDEPFEMSSSLEFFGRTSSTPRSRVDESHSADAVTGPHFAQRPTPREADSDGPDRESSLRADAKQTAPPAPAAHGALDRALSSVLRKETA